MKNRKSYYKRNPQIRNAVLTVFIEKSPWSNDEDFSLYLRKLSFISYFVFQAEFSTSKKEHWQAYLEFNDKVRFSKLRKLFPGAHIEKRLGSSEDAIVYCTKKESRLREPVSFGKKKKSYLLVRSKDTDLPESSEEQKVFIIDKIRNNVYKTSKDVFLDFPYLEWTSKKKVQNLIKDYNPQPIFRRLVPTIWLYGDTGGGKTTWVRRFLHQHKYESHQITQKKASHKHDKKLWFELSDENKRVLWLEEVRTDFPTKNELIKYLDGKDYLPVKGSSIRNNFELIIFNSLLPPWKIYFTKEEADGCWQERKFAISEQEKREVLRRIFEGKVYYIKKDPDSFERCKDLSDNKDFSLCYKPFEELVVDQEPNKALRRFMGDQTDDLLIG